jgi:hypothetical protein
MHEAIASVHSNGRVHAHEPADSANWSVPNIEIVTDMLDRYGSMERHIRIEDL